MAAIIAIVLRAFSRQRTKTAWRYDDWCVVAATVFLVVNQVLFIVIDYLGECNCAGYRVGSNEYGRDQDRGEMEGGELVRSGEENKGGMREGER